MPEAGKFTFRFGADTTEFGAKVAGMVGTMRDRLVAGVTGMLKNQVLQYFSLQGLVNSYRQLIQYADRYYDLAIRSGVATDFLQKVGYAAEQTGSDVAAVTLAIKELKLSAGRLGKEDVAAFRFFGLTAEEVRGGDFEKLFTRILDKAHQFSVEGRNIQQPLQALFGRGSFALMGMIAEGYGELAAQAERAGLIDKDHLKTLADMSDQMNMLRHTWRSLLAEVTPLIVGMANAVFEAVAGWKLLNIEMLKSARMSWLKDFVLLGGAAPGRSTAAAAAADVMGELRKTRLESAEADYQEFWLKYLDPLRGFRHPWNQAGTPGGGDMGLPEAGRARAPEWMLKPQEDQFSRLGLWLTPGAAESQRTVLSVLRDQLREQKRMTREIEAMRKTAERSF